MTEDDYTDRVAAFSKLLEALVKRTMEQDGLNLRDAGGCLGMVLIDMLDGNDEAVRTLINNLLDLLPEVETEYAALKGAH